MEFNFLKNMYFSNTLETWLIALSIVALAYLVGKTIYWFFGSVFKKLTAKTKTKLDDIIVDMVEEPAMMAVIIAGLWYASKILSFSQGGDKFVNAVMGVLIVMNIAWLITRLFESIFKEYIIPLAEKSDTDLDDQLLPVIRKAVKIIVWTLAIIIALDNAGYNIGALLAGLGIGGLLLAMAAKDTVANIFGGITIYVDKPFKIKDRIKIDGFDGTVTEIGIRSTRIKTLAGTEVTIPNDTFSTSAVENITREPTRKIVLNLGLTYDTLGKDMEKAMTVLESIAKKHEDKITKGYKIGFNSFGDFSLGIIFIYYIKKSADILQTQTDINLDILNEFNKNKLSMAFPTQTIELKK